MDLKSVLCKFGSFNGHYFAFEKRFDVSEIAVVDRSETLAQQRTAITTRSEYSKTDGRSNSRGLVISGVSDLSELLFRCIRRHVARVGI